MSSKIQKCKKIIFLCGFILGIPPLSVQAELTTISEASSSSEQSAKQNNPYKELEAYGFTFKSLDKIKALKEKNKATIEKYFNEKTGKFIPNITEQEKILVYRAYIENLDIFSDQQYYRYDRLEPQPIVLEKERKKS